MLVSRLFVPVREVLNVVCVVDCAAEGGGLDEMSPSGRRSMPTSGAGPGSQGRPNRAERSSCEAASLTARNSGATREITRGRGSETPARTGRRNGELPTSCLLLGVSAAPLPRHGNHLRGGPLDPDSHLRSCPESRYSASDRLDGRHSRNAEKQRPPTESVYCCLGVEGSAQPHQQRSCRAGCRKGRFAPGSRTGPKPKHCDASALAQSSDLGPRLNTAGIGT